MSQKRKKAAGQKQARYALRQFDLLPEEFREEIAARRVRGGWILSLSLLLTVLANLLFSDWLKAEATRRYAELIVTQIEPLMAVREVVKTQRELNEQHDRWLQYVETARPDDSLPQALAAIAIASQPHMHDVVIDSIEIQLPVEFPTEAAANAELAWETAPERSTPLITLQARVPSASSANAFLKLLEQQPRIDGATIESHDLAAQVPLLRLRAVPRATRTLP